MASFTLPPPGFAPEQFVADTDGTDTPGSHHITDVDTAQQYILQYLQQRLDAVHNHDQRPATVMLSSGIDSILVAAVAATIFPRITAVTVAIGESPHARQEADSASIIAAHLGIPHRVISPNNSVFAATATHVAGLLDTAEPWEVMAGTMLRLVDRDALDRGAEGPILSGEGADALFLGGKTIPTTGGTSEWVRRWDTEVRASVQSSFTRARFIPDFYERLLADPARHIKVWKTRSAYALALALHPDTIRGPGRDHDKLIFRHLGQSQGLPLESVFHEKSPMQISSGVLAALTQAAREQLAAEFTGRTYSDPLTESADFTVARLFLQKNTPGLPS